MEAEYKNAKNQELRIKNFQNEKTNGNAAKAPSKSGTEAAKEASAKADNSSPNSGQAPTKMSKRLIKKTLYYHFPDHLGSSNLVMDETGKVIEVSDYFPYGEVRVRQSFDNTFSTRKQFTGKEKDASGLYYFGARYYDARLGRFTSADPTAMFSPTGILADPQSLNLYAYARNNPLKYIDPDGKFRMSIHEIITVDAFNISGVNKGWFGRFMNDVLKGVTFAADVAGFAFDYHFDGRQNYSEVQSTWDNLNSTIDNKINDLGSVNKTLGGPDAIYFGRLLHEVQDFYSHSNYVELYIDYYKKNHDGKMPTIVPIYDDALSDEKFKSILEKNLRTGDFSINQVTNPNGKEANKPTSHNKMNKDKADTPAGKLAKNAAARHSTKVLNKLK